MRGSGFRVCSVAPPPQALRRPFYRFAMGRTGSPPLDPPLPMACAPRKIVGVETNEHPCVEYPLAGDPCIADLIACADVDQMRDRVVARSVLERSKIHRDHVGL